MAHLITQLLHISLRQGLAIVKLRHPSIQHVNGDGCSRGSHNERVCGMKSQGTARVGASGCAPAQAPNEAETYTATSRRRSFVCVSTGTDRQPLDSCSVAMPKGACLNRRHTHTRTLVHGRSRDTGLNFEMLVFRCDGLMLWLHKVSIPSISFTTNYEWEFNEKRSLVGWVRVTK